MLLNSANFHPLTKLRTQSHHVGCSRPRTTFNASNNIKNKDTCCVINTKVLHNVQPQQSLPDIIMNLKLNGHNPGLRGFPSCKVPLEIFCSHLIHIYAWARTFNLI